MRPNRHLLPSVAAAVAAVTFLAAAGAHAAGDPQKGEKVFNKCKACHSTEAGKNKIGPYLAGVFGRHAGTAEGYSRYKGLKGADWTWNEKTLDEYLTDPRKFTKQRTGTSAAMTLKLRKEHEREDVIAYLKTLK